MSRVSFVVALCASCGAPNDRPGAEAPSISNLLLPSIQENSEPTLAYFSFKDADGDIEQARIVIHDREGDLAYDETGPIDGMQGKTSGSIVFGLTDTVLGSWVMTFSVMDSRDAASNELVGGIRIVPGFTPATSYAVPSYPGFTDDYRATAAGDLNGDGLNDIAVYVGVVRIFCQRASEPILNAPPTDLQSDFVTKGMAIADVTGDGRADLVLGGTDLDVKAGVKVFPASASGTLGAPVFHPANARVGGYVIARDIDGDGRNDVVTTANGRVHILYQDSSGGLVDSGPLDGPADEPRTELVPDLLVDDMNGDGMLDLVFENRDYALTVGIQISAGTFRFDGPYEFPSSLGTYGLPALASGDLTGDGRADVVATTDFGRTVFVQAADGSFATQAVPPGLESLTRVARVVDLDGDGMPDVIEDMTGRINIYYREGAAFLPAQSYVPSAGDPMPSPEHAGFTLLDVTGDGKDDLIASAGRRGVFVVPQW